MPRTKMDELVEELNSEEGVEQIVKERKPRAKKKHFEPTDGVLCRSITQGGLFMDGEKTQIPYKWTDYGDEIEVEYRDLVAAVRRKSPFVFHPYFVVIDDDFIAEFPQLASFYESAYSLRDLQDILKLPVNEMLAQLRQLPKGALESFKNIASTQVASGKLDSVKKIKALDDFFETDLNLLQSLFQ